MAEIPNVEVNNVRITSETRYGPTGDAIPTTTVSFMLGQQGPFRVSVPTAQFTRDSIKAMIEQQQQHVRGVLELQS